MPPLLLLQSRCTTCMSIKLKIPRFLVPSALSSRLNLVPSPVSLSRISRVSLASLSLASLASLSLSRSSDQGVSGEHWCVHYYGYGLRCSARFFSPPDSPAVMTGQLACDSNMLLLTEACANCAALDYKSITIVNASLHGVAMQLHDAQPL